VLQVAATPTINVVLMVYDPVYLAKPYIRGSMMWVNDPSMVMAPYPCEEATELALPRGKVPHFPPGKSPLPGLNPHITDRFGTPFEARQGGLLSFPGVPRIT